MRAGSPPSNTYMEMIDNWDEIIIGACNGELVEPSFKCKYGVELILKSNYCNEGFLPVEFPSEYKDNIKLKSSFNINDKDYIIPYKYAGFDMVEFGSVVVVGDDLEEIMNEALEIAGSIDAYKLEYNSNALEIAKEELANIEEVFKIKF
jgi:hypothetical protein